MRFLSSVQGSGEGGGQREGMQGRKKLENNVSERVRVDNDDEEKSRKGCEWKKRIIQ